MLSPLTGDAITSISVDSIIAADGQTILTTMLNVDQFKALVNRLLSHD